MEQTTLQQRIEQRADKRLKSDLLTAYKLQCQIRQLLGEDNYPAVIEVRDRSHEKYSDRLPQPYNERAVEIHKALLPLYITRATDEILQKIDEIDYLLENKDLQNQDY